MKNLKEKLANVQVEKLEERKEFTFYICWNPCWNPCNQPSCPDHGDNGEGGEN